MALERGIWRAYSKISDFSAISEGRPHKLSAREERQIISYAQLNRKQNIAYYRCIFNSFSIKTISRKTVRRILKKHNQFAFWRRRKKLKLSKASKKKNGILWKYSVKGPFYLQQKIVRNYIQEIGTETLDWPEYSPDINLVESA